ncbi:MAG: formimidoylglutamase [Flavobacteriales bacterium]|jgi:arginase family enzyme|tara:strand:- start:251 stop:1393 length:1143 start_codon:yes stop_codon:yes gene_type:complete
MIAEYLLPVNNEIVDFKNKLSPLAIGKAITIYGDDQSNLKGFDIALIGLSESRKSSEVNKKYIDINSFRKEFYSLFCGDWNVNIIDMGDVINGEDISDTYFALKTINESLLEKNIISFFIGGTQDLTFPLYQAFAKKGDYVNLTSIDNKFDFGQIKKDFDSSSYMSKIIMEKDNKLSHYCNLGFQTFLNSQEEIDLLEKLQFESHRLGKINKKIDLIEPSLRYTNLLSIDFRSVKASELNFIHNYPNGFESSEICSIARYAGMSDRISCVGVFEVFQNSISSALLAQAVWYFIEGFSLRIIEDPKSENFKGKSYHMDLENHQIKFYQSDISQKWWFELIEENSNKLIDVSLYPCGHEDYLEACNDDISDKLLLSLKRNLI